MNCEIDTDKGIRHETFLSVQFISHAGSYSVWDTKDTRAWNLCVWFIFHFSLRLCRHNACEMTLFFSQTFVHSDTSAVYSIRTAFEICERYIFHRLAHTALTSESQVRQRSNQTQSSRTHTQPRHRLCIRSDLWVFDQRHRKNTTFILASDCALITHVKWLCFFLKNISSLTHTRYAHACNYLRDQMWPLTYVRHGYQTRHKEMRYFLHRYSQDIYICFCVRSVCETFTP